MSNRLNQERQKELEPERMAHAIKKLQALGYVSLTSDETKIEFFHKGEKVVFFPYSGWASGNSIVDGRGLKHLTSQLKS